MSRFLEVLHSGRVLLMDGAMGTELQRAGLKDGECGELWNLGADSAKVGAIHQKYVEAGAQSLLTNTFGSNPYDLERFEGLSRHMQEINRAAVTIARTVAGSELFVLGDIGPTVTDPDPDAIASVVPWLRATDALLLETCSHPNALLAVEHGRIALGMMDMPVLLSFAYHRDAHGRLVTSSGHAPQHFAKEAEGKGVTALGVNCGREIGMDEIIEIIRSYRQETDLPMFARPNAGTPTRIGDRWVYARTPQQMAARLPELLEAGVTMVGGCCGTTPEHIAAFRPIVEEWNAQRSK